MDSQLTRFPGSSTSSRSFRSTGAVGKPKLASDPTSGRASFLEVQKPAIPSFVLTASETFSGSVSTVTACKISRATASPFHLGWYRSLRAGRSGPEPHPPPSSELFKVWLNDFVKIEFKIVLK